MIRILALLGGLVGATGLSQYPAFADAYLQRLGGQVDALATVVADFDNTALASGLTREAALGQMSGTAFLSDRQADLRRTFRRHAVLSDNLAALRAATPVERLRLPHRMTDTATLRATWDDFQPALPLSIAGGIASAGGFVGGWLAALAALSLAAWPFRRHRNRAQTAPRGRSVTRQEPPLRAPTA